MLCFSDVQITGHILDYRNKVYKKSVLLSLAQKTAQRQEALAFCFSQLLLKGRRLQPQKAAKTYQNPA